MSQVLVIALIAVVAIVLIAITLVIARTVGKTRLRALPDESRGRYARMWPGVEARFIDEPATAVQESDKVAVMILSERGANLTDEQRMPEDLRRARSTTRRDQGRRDTEAMRLAMVHYKAIVEDAVGSSRRAPEAGQREMA